MCSRPVPKLPARARQAAGIGLILALSAPAVARSAPAKPPDQPYPDPPTLPGRGLAQHDFLYTGEWDTRNPEETLFLIRGGRVAWTYKIPDRDESNGELSEFSDVHRLSNGDIVFAYKTGWRKIDASGKTLYDFKAPKVVAADGRDVMRANGQPVYSECHTAQPIGPDRVLFMLNGMPAKLCILNLQTGRMEMQHAVRTKEPVTAESIHGQFRNVRRTKNGTFLLAHLNLGQVIEYDRDWKQIWSCDAPSVWHAVRLDNGNTLFTGNQHGFVREVNPKGETVWEVKRGDLPGITLNGIHQAQRLRNGNTVIANWTAGVKKPDWPKIVQVIEVTPDKRVVWAINAWTQPDLGPASCIQLLDEPGRAEAFELSR